MLAFVPPFSGIYTLNDAKSAKWVYRPALQDKKVIETQPPCQDLYICPPSVLPLNVRPPRDTQRHEMPGVEGGFVLSDVLSAEECSELRMATEQIGTSAWQVF